MIRVIAVTVLHVLVTALVTSGYTSTSRVLHSYEDHPCKRPCHHGDLQICRYDFHLEYYYTLSKACYNCPENVTDCFRPHCVPADGTRRAILTVNRMLPGPAIHVCQNDTVEVKVHNELVGGEGTSIHWHGIHQYGSQYMDGVGLVTQCPLQEAGSFVYRFRADPPGTHFWHAHSGMQRVDGIFGALVVRRPLENEPHVGLYDKDLPEHTILISDWLKELAVSRFAVHHHAGGDNKPRALLINGKGLKAPHLNWNETQTPAATFQVTQGLRYRFRTISNGALNCPIQISVDNHTLTMIASDGNSFNKVEVDSFNIYAGERFDFVLTASAPVGNYLIRAIGLADCAVKHAKQVAVLRYTGASREVNVDTDEWNKPTNTGKILNPWNHPGDDDHISVADLSPVAVEEDAVLKLIPDKLFYLGLDFYRINNYHYQDKTYYPLSAVDELLHLYMPQINHISFMFPASPPLTQSRDIDQNVFCNNDTLDDIDCSQEFCECVHRLKVALGDVVEMVVFDEGVIYNASHPMHLHGHWFHIVGMGKLGDTTTTEEIKRLDNSGKLRRNLVNPIAKDTVTVPDGGYVILRFHANNPDLCILNPFAANAGSVITYANSLDPDETPSNSASHQDPNWFWFFHCHLEFHVGIGMGLVIQTGEPDNFQPTPTNFPKCGDWFPSDEDNTLAMFEEPDNNSAMRYSIFVTSSISMLHCILSFS